MEFDTEDQVLYPSNLDVAKPGFYGATKVIYDSNEEGHPHWLPCPPECANVILEFSITNINIQNSNFQIFTIL